MSPRKSSPLTPDDKRHGTVNGYTNHGCRCIACKAASAENQKRYRRTLATKRIPEHVHGSLNGHDNYHCRCRLCHDAKNAYDRDLYLRKRSS